MVEVDEGDEVVDETDPVPGLAGIFSVDEPPRCFWNSMVACEILVVGRSCKNNQNR